MKHSLKLFCVGLFSLLLSGSIFAQQRYPIIFTHGLFVPSQVYTDVVDLKSIFQESGYQLFVAERDLGITGTERAEQLRDFIYANVPEGKFHIIGHSAGGIDARLALFLYKDLAARCLSLTTMATPHHGTNIADERYEQGNNPSISNPDSWSYYLLFEGTPDGKQIAYELTTEGMAEFNKLVKDDDNVKYFSYGWYIEQPYWLYTRPYVWSNAKKMAELGIISDGTVPLESAKWGQFMGAFPGDHLSETSPIPYGKKGGVEIYQETFKRAMKNLDDHFLVE